MLLVVNRIILILEELLLPPKDVKVMLLCDVVKILVLLVNYGILFEKKLITKFVGILDLFENLSGRIVLRLLQNMSLLRKHGNYGDGKMMLLNIRIKRRRDLQVRYEL